VHLEVDLLHNWPPVGRRHNGASLSVTSGHAEFRISRRNAKHVDAKEAAGPILPAVGDPQTLRAAP
jgi:hypothetical protein